MFRMRIILFLIDCLFLNWYTIQICQEIVNVLVIATFKFPRYSWKTVQGGVKHQSINKFPIIVSSTWPKNNILSTKFYNYKSQFRDDICANGIYYTTACFNICKEVRQRYNLSTGSSMSAEPLIKVLFFTCWKEDAIHVVCLWLNKTRCSIVYTIGTNRIKSLNLFLYSSYKFHRIFFSFLLRNILAVVPHISRFLVFNMKS
jgi:hypothetical protein